MGESGFFQPLSSFEIPALNVLSMGWSIFNDDMLSGDTMTNLSTQILVAGSFVHRLSAFLLFC